MDKNSLQSKCEALDPQVAEGNAVDKIPYRASTKCLTKLDKYNILNESIDTILEEFQMPCGQKRKRQKMATHKRKKMLKRNRHKSK